MGDVIEDDLLDHIDSVVSYVSDRNSRVDADVIECLNELDGLGIFDVTDDNSGQAASRMNPMNDLLLPEGLLLEDIWRTAYNNR